MKDLLFYRKTPAFYQDSYNNLIFEMQKTIKAYREASGSHKYDGVLLDVNGWWIWFTAGGESTSNKLSKPKMNANTRTALGYWEPYYQSRNANALELVKLIQQ